uniref:Uncharacterized protein n=1 Tax=Vitis vinifera TaxID=29760 RepID=F6HIF2_VITVI
MALLQKMWTSAAMLSKAWSSPALWVVRLLTMAHLVDEPVVVMVIATVAHQLGQECKLKGRRV